MQNLAYFTEAMRKVYSMVKRGEYSDAAMALNTFLEMISVSDLQEITSESRNGRDLIKMKKNPLLIVFLLFNIPTEITFEEWISNFSRSWTLLN